MKTGRNIQEIAAEIQRQQETKHDYIADTRKVRFRADEECRKMYLHLEGQEEGYGITPVFHSQMSTNTAIPKRYYDRMLADSPALLASNVNHWLENQPSQRMVRTLDGRARALLSDRFRPMDNVDLAESIFPMFQDMGVDVASMEITETRFYAKVVQPKVRGEVKVGDVVQAGLVITNSEVGLGALKVEPMLYRLVCENGMVMGESLQGGFRRMHLGRRIAGDQDGGAPWEIFSNDTRKASDKALWMQVKDVVGAAMQMTFFEQSIEVMRNAAGMPIEADVASIVEVTAKHYALTEGESKGVLDHLAKGGELSLYGLANAVTRYSQDVASYDRATELERTGGQIIEMPQSAWKTINKEAEEKAA